MRILRYENMKKDMDTVIRDVSDFLTGRQLSEDKIASLTEHLSFAKMKDNTSVNYDRAYKVFEMFFGESGHFMRCGEIGSYKKEISSEMEREIDKWIEKNVAETKIDLASI